MDLREAHTNQTRRHPWETARARFFTRILVESGALARVRSALDVGAGDAWFAGQLALQLPQGARLHCVDSEYTPATVAALQPTLPAQVTLCTQPPSGPHDLLLLLDVLEHVPDDRAFLGELIGRELAPGGYLLVSVPAWQGLFTSHDTFLKHFRRYGPPQARAVLEGAGLHIVRSGGLFHSLLLPRFVGLLRERALGAPSQDQVPHITWRAGRQATAALDVAFSLDNAASRLLSRWGADVPGLTWWALCRK